MVQRVPEEHNHVEIAELLLEAGAAPDELALDLAAARGHADLVRLLLDAGLDPNAMGAGRLPLHLTASSGSAQDVRLWRGARSSLASRGPGCLKRGPTQGPEMVGSAPPCSSWRLQDLAYLVCIPCKGLQTSTCPPFSA